ncbi:sensor histidine kinase [Agrococcus casei]|uniref:histidine kinase n=2 Tax=Agrococcus TaxID=46352 RepID=A0A1R4GCL2_9MICO|nr:HAMP domain-containing sensor histidine kinase [Agrococcus casei]SJM65938.1 Histidine kinase sensor of two-component system [Agrococcus casei LMG 22410]
MFSRITQQLKDVSLAARISLLIVVIMTFGLTVAGVGTVSVLRDSLVRQLDIDLEDALASFNYSDISPNDLGGSCQLDQSVPNSYVLAVLTPDGEPLCSNRPDGRAYPDMSTLTLPFVASTDKPFIISSESSDTQWRAVARPVTLNGTNNIGTLVIATSLDGVTGSWRSFTLIYMGFSVIAILLGAALTRVFSESALRGLREVATSAESFAAGDYETRLVSESKTTEIGRLNDSLNTMLDRIESAMAQRDESVSNMRAFIGDASHELRTPLVTVRGYAELYRMGALQNPDDIGSAMERIESEAKRMGTLVEDLLTLARLDEKRPLKLEPIDLVPLVSQAASDARAQDTERRFKVVEVDPDATAVIDATTAGTRPEIFAPPPMLPPAVVIADENAIRQLIANLITNALRYTPACSPIELGVGVSWQRREAQVHVIDHGPGIPGPLRAKIFERFFRADKSRDRETGGSGLGLAIVAGLVEAHNGTVDAVETPGGGATFRITLPLADDKSLRELARRISAEANSTTGGSPQPHTQT